MATEKYTKMTAIEITENINTDDPAVIDAKIIRTEPPDLQVPLLRNLLPVVGLAFGTEVNRFFKIELTDEQKKAKFKITSRKEGSMMFVLQMPEFMADYFANISPELAVILADDSIVHLHLSMGEAATGKGRTEAHEWIHALLDASDSSEVKDAIDVVGRALQRLGIEMINDPKVTKLSGDKQSGFGEAKIHIGVRDIDPRNVGYRQIHTIKYLTLPSKLGKAGNTVTLSWPQFLLTKLNLCRKCNRFLDGMATCGLCASAGSSSSAPARVTKRKAADAYAARVAKRNGKQLE